MEGKAESCCFRFFRLVRIEKRDAYPEHKQIDVLCQDAYTRAGSAESCVYQEVLGVVEPERSHPEEGSDSDEEVARRRVTLANVYEALPAYGSATFWRAIEEPEIRLTLPLEVLVRCVRAAIAYGDNEGRNRIIEMILRRSQTTNEYWVNSVLKDTRLQADERNALTSDLYADLCEHVIRALIDPKRLFWEENFQHSLRFERKHVYQTFMTREGRWNNPNVKRSTRIPHALVASLDQPVQLTDGEVERLDVEDERAQQALLAVEHADLPRLILHLPEKLKSVVLLIFWEGRTEKDTAQVLGITDRTVRNRLREALNVLHSEIGDHEGHTVQPERGGVYG